VFPSGITTGNNVLPFDPFCGTLTSFDVVWDIDCDLHGTASDTGLGGGAVRAGPILWPGSATPEMATAWVCSRLPAFFFDFPFEVVGSQGFSVPAITYDPAILAAVEGRSRFALSWDAPYMG
jgi:hypothetical protein